MTAQRRLLLAGLACAVLIAAAPAPTEIPAALAAGDLGTALSATCGGIALLISAGLLASVALLLGARLPGALGRACDALAAHCIPTAWRATLVAALALGGVVGPALGAAAETVRPHGLHAGLPDLDRPAGLTPSLTAPSPRPAPRPAQPPSVLPHSAAPTPERPAQTRGEVVVHRGDSLWQIAQRRLGRGARPALVAAAWPRWWAANRAVIGPDPDLIHPGDRLAPPTD